MAEFSPQELRRQLFCKKYMVPVVTRLALKEIGEPFRASSLAEELDISSPLKLYPSLVLLRSQAFGLVGPELAQCHPFGDRRELFRKESELWLPVIDIATELQE